ncbi:alpha-ketoglutarate-dependent dioxygenase AlkB family protein [Methylomonas albis]|uniref:Alpha-ketoglutarate-dependent dioxygenase AlkB n=1 Tax=Methylomonas albis TaxID=1854563 RepID=A0ABR9D659_9GAMM|nr:alpha-ketoglutarate-dependent dioxygenase AlkB [Methylomonas albis]MBD9357699.1 alpha-ketoglutarate-dependent dioxygenase AlkB [Methylomonas albis]
MPSSNALLANHQNLAPRDGELFLLPAFYPLVVADKYLQKLMQNLAWQTEQIHLYGRWVPVPRLMAWYGDPDADYRYSGVDHQPLPWTTDLQPLRSDAEAVCQQPFNSVLANLYRNGRDSMGCHADNEKELGPNPLIASLSFGETRLLRFRHAHSRTTVEIELSHGDLLIMAGELQHHWRHELPKTRQVKQARINLTFRRIVSTPNSPGLSAAR